MMFALYRIVDWCWKLVSVMELDSVFL